MAFVVESPNLFERQTREVFYQRQRHRNPILLVAAERFTLSFPTIELLRFKTPPHPCHYLATQTACMDYRFIVELSPEAYDELLRRGWRRNGNFFFRTACSACSECKSLRVPVADFTPSKSQRRAVAKNSTLRLVVQPPSVTPEHLDLWNRFHGHMQQRRGWPESKITEREYIMSFVAGDFSFARELLYYDQDRLVAVGLVDVTGTSLSSVYFFHDPERRSRALGVYSLVTELKYAQEHGLEHAYLGYWVRECASMNYKAGYRPHELLVALPGDDAAPIWNPVV